MSAPKLSHVRAAELLREVAAEQPDRVEKQCRYADGDKPCCLVGHVLARAGWPIEALHVADTLDGGDDPTAAEHLPEHPLFAGLDQAAADLLEAAQSQQDKGFRWAEAAARALGDGAS